MSAWDEFAERALFSFGRHTERDAGKSPAGLFGALGGRMAADPGLLQLLPLQALRAEAEALALAAHPRKDARPWLTHAAALMEVARRTGEIETLGRAASALQRARVLAEGDKRLTGEALLAHAAVLVLAADLFGDHESAAVARGKLDAASAHPLSDPDRARLTALRGRLLAREALETGAQSLTLAAMEVLAHASAALEAAGDEAAAAEARCDRAELLIAAGARAKDRGRLDLALEDLAALSGALDPAFQPLAAARVETLRGQALATLGDLMGDAAALAHATALLRAAVEELPAEHSPLDAARAGHALGLSLQALGEACEDEALFDEAVTAFTPALEALDGQPMLPFRSVVAHDAAACVARRAERRGDLPALERAEAAFRDALKSRSAAKDPLSWAVTQVALARIYEAEADLRGDTGERADAAFALTSALEVFAEKGLRSLADVALTALERVRTQPA